MNKIIFTFFLIFSSTYLSASNFSLEKARKKINSHNSLSFNTTAYYPIPETDEINKFTTFYIVNNYKSKNFDFFSKTGNDEEIFKNGEYKRIKNNEKTEYQFEEIKNQTEQIQNSHLVQYGPIFLLNLNWNFVDEVLINKEKFSHFSYIESTRKYQEKTIKVEYNIYISQKNLVSKFERKSFVDDKLGQTVTYEFSDYRFSKNEIDFNYSLPKNYALKYFEKIDINPLEKGAKAPDFVAIDFENREFSEKNFVGNKTLLLFSSTGCGASKDVSDFMYSSDFKLSNKLNLINFFTTDSKEIVQKYFKNKANKFPIIADRKDIENSYKISVFPVLYVINYDGIIEQTYIGEEITDFFKANKSE